MKMKNSHRHPFRFEFMIRRSGVWWVGAVLLWAIVGVFSASGATFSYSATLDLSQFNTLIYNSGTMEDFNLALTGTPVFTMNPGDVVSGTILFANQQSIRVSDPSGTGREELALTFLSQGSAPSTSFTSAVQLSVVSGSLMGSNPQIAPVASSGAILADFDLKTKPFVSFSGFTYSLTLNSDSGTDTGSNMFSPKFVEITAPVNMVSVIPEPGAMGLACAGCAMLGMARLRRRGAVKAVNAFEIVVMIEQSGHFSELKSTEARK